MLYDYEDRAKKMTNGKLTPAELQNIHTLTDTIKNIDKIQMLEDGGYSEDGDWKAYGYYDDNSYNSSYARGRRGNVRRDSMGRYSREDGYSEGRMNDRGSSYEGRRGYSRDDAKDYMIEQLEEMKESAGTEKERQAISHCIKQLESA